VIVLLETVHPEALALLERADTVRLMAVPTGLDNDVPRDEVRAVLTRGRGRITAEMCSGLPNLEVVGRCGAGLDNIDVVAAESSGIAVVHAPGRTTHAVSEHGLLLMLALARRVVMLDRSVKQGVWDVREGYEGFELRGKRLGIIGLGAIGRRLAGLGNALDMNVVYWSRASRDPNLELLELDDLLATADVIQICLALTPETHGLIGHDRIARMKPGVLLINTSRAQIIDHVALIAALAAGTLGGHGTDVWDPEPPGSDDLASVADRIVITPHVAGLTDVTFREICVGPAAATVAILAGETPDPTCVHLRSPSTTAN
jgi:phosphoglycerate dehydrogenase-like enzyme